MRLYNFLFFVFVSLYACNQKPKTQQPATPPPADTAAVITPAPPPPAAGIQNETKASDTARTVTLLFSGYDEGDYAHLLFKETDSGKEYDFGHPDDNNLGENKIVLRDSKTSFGYKENIKMVGTTYTAELVYKLVDTHDTDGQPKKAKEWRITKLTRNQ